MPRHFTGSACRLVLLVVLCAVLLGSGFTASQANSYSPFQFAAAKDCVAMDDNTVWKHAAGLFHRYAGGPGKPTGVWIEYDSDRRKMAEYVEVQQQSGTVILRDTTRDVEILLRRDVCAIKHRNDNEFQQLHAGTWVKVAWCS